MRAVARLLWIYFTGTLLARVISLIGLACVLVGGAAVLRYLPLLTTQLGLQQRFTLAEEAAMIALPLVGILALFFGSSLMPLVFGRLAMGHQIHVLPGGRAKLLASALCTALLIALTAGGVGLVYYTAYQIDLGSVFARGFTVSFLTYSALYVVFWTISRLRSAPGVLAGAMLVIIALAVPARFIALPGTSLVWMMAGAALSWSLFAAAFLLAPRLKARFTRVRGRLSFAKLMQPTYSGGRELDLIMGTGQPWLLAVAQIAPVSFAAVFIGEPKVWLFFLTLFSAISGAIASVAAARSRALWLRTSWNRAELFARVENAYWRHNAYALGVLSLLLVAIGSYMRLPTRLLAFGLPILALGTLTSTYLGLMMTRGIGWRETVVAVAAMALLMATAVTVTDDTVRTSTIVVLEAVLLVLAAAFRYIAKRRWSGLDWTLCRPELTVRSSS
jgi:hypothetical protein